MGTLIGIAGQPKLADDLAEAIDAISTADIGSKSTQRVIDTILPDVTPYQDFPGVVDRIAAGSIFHRASVLPEKRADHVTVIVDTASFTVRVRSGGTSKVFHGANSAVWGVRRPKEVVVNKICDASLGIAHCPTVGRICPAHDLTARVEAVGGCLAPTLCAEVCDCVSLSSDGIQ